MRTKTMKIEVTAHDIFAGIPTDPSSCPVAIAISRTLQASPLCVYSNHVQISGDLPDEAMQFIKAFDGRKEVKPFTFYITLVMDDILAG